MKKKTISALLTSALVLCTLAGCGAAPAETAEAPAETAESSAETAEAPAEGAEAAAEETSEAAAEETSEASETAEITTVKPGVLTVATSPDFAPYEFYAIDENGTPSLAGFDVAMAHYIADKLGLELEIITVDFDGVLSELATKSVDIGMAGLSPDPEREAIMSFSDLYYKGGQSFVTVEAKKDKVTSMEVANAPEFTIGAQTGSIQLDLANENTPNASIVSMPKVTDIVSELIAGKEDGAFIETDVVKCYQKNYPELVIVEDVPYEQEGSAIGVCKGNDALLAAVNEAIASALEDGSLEQFVAEANELATGEKYEGLLDEETGLPAGAADEQ